MDGQNSGRIDHFIFESSGIHPTSAPLPPPPPPSLPVTFHFIFLSSSRYLHHHFLRPSHSLYQHNSRLIHKFTAWYSYDLILIFLSILYIVLSSLSIHKLHRHSFILPFLSPPSFLHHLSPTPLPFLSLAPPPSFLPSFLPISSHHLPPPLPHPLLGRPGQSILPSGARSFWNSPKLP